MMLILAVVRIPTPVSFQSDDHLHLRACLEFPITSRHFPASLTPTSLAFNEKFGWYRRTIIKPSRGPRAPTGCTRVTVPSTARQQCKIRRVLSFRSTRLPCPHGMQWSPRSNAPCDSGRRFRCLQEAPDDASGRMSGCLCNRHALMRVQCYPRPRVRHWHPAAPWLGPTSAFAGIGGSSHTWAWSKFRSMFMECASSSTSHGIMLMLVASDMDILLPNSIRLSNGLRIGFEAVMATERRSLHTSI
ncbi:hypothetical protein C8Q74DRAFT_91425 [Fomes fomentarius]|nr:hypothetical protein C8Q74DRAFT_91425 [Fomes fomentarius]